MSADAEAIKLASNYLGGTIGEELANDRDDFDHDAELLLKFQMSDRHPLVTLRKAYMKF